VEVLRVVDDGPRSSCCVVARWQPDAAAWCADERGIANQMRMGAGA
jgi:hypothetical protein